MLTVDALRAAALVIQGSACVYSKKVEHLHTLVYQALEFIASEKRYGFIGPQAFFLLSKVDS